MMKCLLNVKNHHVIRAQLTFWGKKILVIFCNKIQVCSCGFYSTFPVLLLLQLEISTLERSRSVMAEELVRLTSQNDEMEEKVKEIPKLKIQLKVNTV